MKVPYLTLCASLLLSTVEGQTGNLPPGNKAGVTVQWTVDQAAQTVTFTASAATTGWISVAFSETGQGHLNTDSCTGWVIDGVATVLDGYSDVTSQPVIDAQNDCTVDLAGSNEVGGVTTLVFTRPLAANGQDDVAITNTAISVITSIGDTDGTGETFPIHGGGIYDIAQANIIDPTAAAPGGGITINLKADEGVTLTVSVIAALYAALKWGRILAKKSRSEVLIELPKRNNDAGNMMQRFTNRMSSAFGQGMQNMQQASNRVSQMFGMAPPQPGRGGPSFNGGGGFRQRPYESPDGPSVMQNGGLPGMRLTRNKNMNNPMGAFRSGGAGAGNARTRPMDISPLGLQRFDQPNAVATKLMPKTVQSSAKNSRSALLKTRMFGSQISLGDTILGALFFAINMVWMFITANPIPAAFLPSIAKNLGYLCSPSMIFVALPATRNSILTWALQMPFERTIMFHRWLGRWLMLISTVHMGIYFFQWFQQGQFMVRFSQQKNIYGYISWLFLLLLYVSSLWPVRRRHYNTFKWLHFSFFGFYIVGVLHSPTITNYAIAAGVFYGLDRLLRFYLGLQILTAYEVRVLEGGVIRIRFQKHKGIEYEAGQYVFLKIPVISKVEWHPYTLSSGPHEDYAEVHIKSLGDHTTKLINTVNAGGQVPTVRVDGPYGRLSLDYNRFETIVLIGGGVGVTPMVSILKDIYQINMSDQAKSKHKRSPWIRNVYLIWTVPSADEWRWFSSIINEALALSNMSGTNFPRLTVFANLTKGGGSRPLSTMHSPNKRFFINNGRPDLRNIFNQVENEVQAEKQGQGHRAAVYACGPSRMVNQAWDMSKKFTKGNSSYAYHHEVFDF